MEKEEEDESVKWYSLGEGYAHHFEENENRTNCHYVICARDEPRDAICLEMDSFSYFLPKSETDHNICFCLKVTRPLFLLLPY